MGSSSTKVKKYLQHGDELSAMQVTQDLKRIKLDILYKAKDIPNHIIFLIL
jgi:hypothetical protein